MMPRLPVQTRARFATTNEEPGEAAPRPPVPTRAPSFAMTGEEMGDEMGRFFLEETVRFFVALKREPWLLVLLFLLVCLFFDH